MTSRDDVQRAIRAAVDRGDIPAGGPSEAAAYDLELPTGYWKRWSSDAAERISRDAAAIYEFLEQAKQSFSGVREPSPGRSTAGLGEIRAQRSTRGQSSRDESGEQDE